MRCPLNHVFFENIANEEMFLFRILELTAMHIGCVQLHETGEGASQECFVTWGDGYLPYPWKNALRRKEAGLL